MRKISLSILALLANVGSAAAATVSLQLYPPEIRVHIGESQTVLLIATGSDGVSREVTADAKWNSTTQSFAALTGTRTLTGLEQGSGELIAVFDGITARAPVEILPARRHELSFINDIVPIFTKADCANSNCHGSVRGQKGFKLSLFGSDPELDYDAITKNSEGRRIDRAHPAKSLVLMKPTMQVAHGGGLRFQVDSPEYKLMLAWLTKGASYDAPGQARLRKLSVYPPEYRLTGAGNTLQLVATGEYSDGSVRDLTRTVRYSSNEAAIASVSSSGSVRAEMAGETAIMARTMGQAAAVPIMVAKDRPMANYPVVPETNFIDKHVFAKLRTINVVPSELSTDEEFVRRVHLDTVGHPPSIEEVTAFLSSTRSDKRSVLIDQLLERPERADTWAMRFADMYRAGYNEAGPKGGGAYGRWFRDQVRKDVPYDEMVRQLLVSQGRHDFEGISNFYFVSREITPEESGTNVSQLLLGLQIECARCHNHPFEKWSQDDFYGFAAFFARVGRKDMYLNNHNGTYLKESGDLLHPKTRKPVTPKYLDGDLEPVKPNEDVREKLAAWVTNPRNPYFARATMNRVWKFFMGRGLVEPVDDFRVTNPSTNDPLLNALAAEFVKNGYSLKAVERQILNSRTYQLSSTTNSTNRDDQVNYSHFFVRRLMSEQIMDSMSQVTGIPEKFPGTPLGKRAMSIPVLPFMKPHYMMKVFGRNDLREVICERDTKPSVAQVMHLVSGDTIQRQITTPGGNLDLWLEDKSLTDWDIVSRLYLAALSRNPQPDEAAAALQPFESGVVTPVARRRAFEDLVWAIFNSKEFLFHH
jgi:Protein of unknown function (DUF1553)/Protein of unknown function (DUF1549)/Bacterial Ig-like domain (group 2)